MKKRAPPLDAVQQLCTGTSTQHRPAVHCSTQQYPPGCRPAACTGTSSSPPPHPASAAPEGEALLEGGRGFLQKRGGCRHGQICRPARVGCLKRGGGSLEGGGSLHSLWRLSFLQPSRQLAPAGAPNFKRSSIPQHPAASRPLAAAPSEPAAAAAADAAEWPPMPKMSCPHERVGYRRTWSSVTPSGLHSSMAAPSKKSLMKTARKGVTRSLMPCTYPLAGCLRRQGKFRGLF